MNEQYNKWGYYGAGIFMGFLNSTSHPEILLWQGAAIAVITVIVLCTVTWVIYKVFPRTNCK